LGSLFCRLSVEEFRHLGGVCHSGVTPLPRLRISARYEHAGKEQGKRYESYFYLHATKIRLFFQRRVLSCFFDILFKII
jgi:hypothetical protein